MNLNSMPNMQDPLAVFIRVYCNFFPFLIKYYQIIFIIIVVCPQGGSGWIIGVGQVCNLFNALGVERSQGLVDLSYSLRHWNFFVLCCLLYFFSLPHLSCSLLLLLLCVISFSLFPCFCFLFLCSFLNCCGCSMAKSKTPAQETFFYPLNGTEHGSQPSLITRDRELVSILEVTIEPGDLNQRPLTPQPVTLPTLPRAGWCECFGKHSCKSSTSYSHTEWDLFFYNDATTCAQKTLEMRQPCRLQTL